MSTPETPVALIADDDAALAMLAAAALEQHGFRTIVVEDGAEALAAAREQRPDLLLLDVDMPALTGFEVCRRIRALDRWGQLVPMVILTGHEDTASVEEAYAVEATDFIAKPVNWALLGHRMRYVLRSARAAQDLAASEARNRTLLEALPDLVVVTDASGAIVEHVSRTGAVDFAGHPLWEVLPGYWPSIRHHVAQIAAEGRPRTCEYEPEDRDGRYFEIRYVPQTEQRILVIARDISEKRRIQAHVHRLAYHDSITGLPNRHYLLEKLGSLGAADPDRGIVVLILTFERFAHIGHYLGLNAADDALRAIASRLLARLEAHLAALPIPDQENPPGFSLARLEGATFAVLLTGLPEEAAAIGAGRSVRKAFQEPLSFARQNLVLSPSVGIARAPSHGTNAEELLRNASAAAKRAAAVEHYGFCLFEPALSAIGQARLQLEGALRDALDQGRLSIHLQPKFALATSAIEGAECLLRWTDPERGSVSPGDFIPVAEETGLIGEIDRYVVREALAHARRWREQGRPITPLAVNLSARAFFDPTLPDFLGRSLDDAGLPAWALELEITEGVLMHDTAMARRNLKAIRELGCRVAIDDFGTGFSSLAYLKQFPVQTLKIDRMFVSRLEEEAESRAIVRSVIVLAHTLGMSVVAEGVETEFQQSFLRAQGCELVQGFLLARPLPEGDFLELCDRIGGAGPRTASGAA
jgi:diguanylate cyclase (GGDEF)-like protein